MRKIFIIFVSILIICTGCGVDLGKNSPGVTATPTAANTPEPTVNAIATPEPTPTVTITPYPTPIPAVDDYYLSSDSVILRCGLKISDLKGYFDFTKSELIRKLGGEYDIVNFESQYNGYYYRKLGITLFFFSGLYANDMLSWIDCDTDKLELNGLTPDMDFEQIQDRIGTEVLVKTGTGEEGDEYEYELIYRVGYFLLRFTSSTKDGKGFKVSID